MRIWCRVYMQSKTLLFFCFFAIFMPCPAIRAQSTPPSPAKVPTHESSKSAATTSTGGAVEILNPISPQDLTIFADRLPKIIARTKKKWYRLVPEEARPPEDRKGEVDIRLTLLPNGKITDMMVFRSSGDKAMDAAAWHALQHAAPFHRLPRRFHAKRVMLQFNFLYNQSPVDEQHSAPSR